MDENDRSYVECAGSERAAHSAGSAHDSPRSKAAHSLLDSNDMRPTRCKARLLRLTAAAVLVIGVVGAVRAETCGDSDGDGTLSVTDGVRILRAGAGLGDACAAASHRCDLDGSGTVTVTDGVNALRLAAGLSATARCDRGEPRPCDPAAGPLPVFGRRADFPPSLPMAASCGSDGGISSNYVMPTNAHVPDAAEELHVIAVYEGTLPDGFSPVVDGRRVGVVRVEVRATAKPVSLFLSALEPVRWQLVVQPGASLARVVTHGQYEQRVEGAPTGVPVTSWSPSSGFGCMYGWEVEANLGGCDYWTLIREIREFTGLTETSFQACYDGDRFEVPHWTGDAPACRVSTLVGDEARAPSDVRLSGCEALAAEEDHCLTLTSGFGSSTWNLAVVGVESGDLCVVSPIQPGLSLGQPSSIGWRGEMLYACAEQGLVRIALHDGAWEAAQIPCEAVSADADRLYVMRSFRDPLYDPWLRENVDAYESYEDALAGAAVGAYALPFTSRMTVHGDRLYGAWHATDTVDVVSLTSAAALGSIKIQGYDGWIDGIALTDEDHLVVAGTDAEGGSQVSVYDVETGKRTHAVSVPQRISGLACAPRAD